MMPDKDVSNFAVERLRAAIEKNAGFWSGFTQSLTPNRMGAQAGDAVLAAGATAAVTGMGVAIKSGYDALKSRLDKPKAFKGMLEADPSLRKKDQKAVQMTFNTLYSFNKDMAKDPLSAASFVGRSTTRSEMSEGVGSYIDPQTVRMIADTRRQDTPILNAASMGAGKAFKSRTIDPDTTASRSRQKLSSFRKQYNKER